MKKTAHDADQDTDVPIKFEAEFIEGLTELFEEKIVFNKHWA